MEGAWRRQAAVQHPLKSGQWTEEAGALWGASTATHSPTLLLHRHSQREHSADLEDEAAPSLCGLGPWPLGSTSGGYGLRQLRSQRVLARARDGLFLPGCGGARCAGSSETGCSSMGTWP